MKKYLMSGALALIGGLFVTSCHEDDVYGNSDAIDQKVQNFQKVFKEAFGPINPNQTWGFNKNGVRAATSLASNANMSFSGYNPDWGFNVAANARTRGVFTETWSGVHAGCKFSESVFDMNVPSNAVDITKSSFTDVEKNATIFYIPSNFNGNVNFYAFNIPAGAKIYNLGTVTEFNANHNGVTTFYNVGNMTYTISSGSRHTVINSGILTVKSFANIGDVYNKGTLRLDNWGYKADIPNDMHIYSNGEGSIIIPNGADFKAVCDIHGTITVTNGDLKIQNGTKKYICGIVALNGTIENVDGPLETSYVKANVFKFDGNPIYLLPGGHVDVTTLQVPNSNCHFYGATGSTGLVEAKNFEFGNKNDFTHTFSSNIYFKSNGGYVKVDNCYAMGQSHYFNTVADYLADTTHSDEFALAKDRINAGNAAGSPACGEPWTVGAPGTTPETPSTPNTPNNPNTPDTPNTPNTPDNENKTERVVDGNTTIETVYEYFNIDSVGETGRIFCEDLGGNYSNREDLDYNDAVFNVTLITRTQYCTTTITTITDAYTDSTLVENSDTTYYEYYEVEADTTYTDYTEKIEDSERYFVQIDLYAAGGTVPLRVAGVEVHEAFGVGVTTMVNTRDANTPTVNGANTVAREPVTLKNPKPTTEHEEWFEGYRDAIEVPIHVYYGNINDVMELQCNEGQAPHKIKVNVDTQWASERCYLGNAYPDFVKYVSDGTTKWESTGDQGYLYSPLTLISTEAVGNTNKTITNSESVTEHILYENAEGYDISRGLYFTNRDLLINKDIQVGDRLRFYATKDEDIKPEGWCIFLADGNSTRLHADQTSLNNHDYAEVTLTADLVSKLRSNNTNAAMVISGYGAHLTKVTLIKK